MRVALIQCDWVLIKGDIWTQADTEGVTEDAGGAPCGDRRMPEATRTWSQPGTDAPLGPSGRSLPSPPFPLWPPEVGQNKSRLFYATWFGNQVTAGLGS